MIAITECYEPLVAFLGRSFSVTNGAVDLRDGDDSHPKSAHQRIAKIQIQGH